MTSIRQLQLNRRLEESRDQLQPKRISVKDDTEAPEVVKIVRNVGA